MLLRRGFLLFFEVFRKFSRSHGPKQTSILTQIGRFRTVTKVWIHWSLWNDAQILKQHRRGALLFLRSSVKFRGHTGEEIVAFDPNWAFTDYNSTLNSPMALKSCTILGVVEKRCPFLFQGHPSNVKVTRDKNISFIPELRVSGLWIEFKFTDGIAMMDKANRG